MKYELDALAAAFVAAKEAETAAIAERRRIAKLIEDNLPGPDEGTASSTLNGFKLTVTRKVNRKIDSDALSKAWGEISANTQAAFKWDASLVTKHYRALQELGTAELAEANQFITSKPATASVEVEITDKE